MKWVASSYDILTGFTYPGYCTCEDGTMPNDLGYCCPIGEVFELGSEIEGQNDGHCTCPRGEHIVRNCRSRNPDENCDDSCQCDHDVPRNDYYDECCGKEAYPS